MTLCDLTNTPRKSARRLKIFALHSTKPMLGTGSGDVINEARFLTSLSQFADVYYNGTLFQPNEPDYGLNATEIIIPDSGYDLYYVRANPELFAQLPHPKIAMGYPYVESVFREADALVVTTDAWKRGLEPYDPQTNIHSSRMTEWYGNGIISPKHIINIKQTMDPSFLEEPEPAEILEARMRLGFFKAIGFFGRIQDNTFPSLFLAAYKKVITQHPDIKFAVGGTVRMPLDRSILKLPRLPHDKMPALLSSCMATATDEGNDSMFLGSGKVLDSMACGVPIIAFKSPTRVEQLGDDYPLYYESVDECEKRIREAIFDEELRIEVKKQLSIRSKIFEPQCRATEIEKDLTEVVVRYRVNQRQGNRVEPRNFA